MRLPSHVFINNGRVLRKLINYQSERFTDEEDIHLNEIHNYFCGFSGFWCIFIVLSLSGFWTVLLFQDFDRYFSYLYWYTPSITGLSGLFIFFLRFRYEDPFILTYVGYILLSFAQAYICIITPYDSLYFLLILALVPAPFYLVPFTKRKILLLLIGFHSLMVILVYVIVFAFDPILLYPKWVSDFARPAVAIGLVVSFYQVIFGFRHADKNYRALVDQAREETEIAYKKVKARDERIQNELDFAADIQHSVMPRSHPDGQFYSINIKMIAYGKVTGDYVDVVKHQSQTYFFICDASGHGAPAALVTLLAQQAFRDTLAKEQSPAVILDTLNKLIYDTVQTTDYLTAFLAVLSSDGTLTFSSGGHAPALLVQLGGREIEMLEADGTVIGIVSEAPAPFKDRQLQMQPGDRLIVYTDGLVDEKNLADNEVGLERLQAWVSELVKMEHKEFHTQLFEIWQSFVEHKNYRDDITLVSIEYTGQN